MAPIKKNEAADPERYDNIEKSPNDKRNYRGLILHNKLKVLLVSDPTADKSAASLAVNAGYASNPQEFPDLAQFYAHMLSYGTSKYPEIDDYDKYFWKNGGYAHVDIDTDSTNYHFYINHEKLEESLDRFSQIFVSPLFTESVIEKEIKVWEHKKHLANNNHRLIQLYNYSADPSQAYSKYGTPNDIKKELLNFQKNYYSANVMTLSVIGKENLDELEKMVVRMFSEIENKEVKPPTQEEYPYKGEHYRTKWYVVPQKDERHLALIFPVPDMQKHYRIKPLRYWSYLYEHQGKGSLYSVLKENGWIYNVFTAMRSSNKGFDFFKVQFDLTEDGLKHVDDIITMTHQYRSMLKKDGPASWIYEEYRDVSNIKYRYKEQYPARSYVRWIAEHLQVYPITEVLSGPYHFSEWNPQVITDFSKYLEPENMRVRVMAKTFETVTDKVEPFYETKYRIEKISDEDIKKYSTAGEGQLYSLPEKNAYVPSKFDIKPYEQGEKHPQIIEDTPYMRVWFKQDNEYHVPKASMYFDFVSPLAWLDSVTRNMTYMFVRLFRDSVNEHSYYAQLAGLRWEFSYTKYGFRMWLTGYDHKMDVFLHEIFNQMENYKVDEKRFQMYKDYYVRWLKNYEVEQPFEHADYYLHTILSEHAWDWKELLEATKEMTIERIQQFIPMLMGHMHVEVLIHGNMTKPEAHKIVKEMEHKITARKYATPVSPKHLLLHRVHELGYGDHHVYKMENKYHKSSSTQIYYQYGLQSTESNALLELFAQIIAEPFYHTMYTKEQVGYVVFSDVYRRNGVQGFRVTVQSDKHPEEVEKKIDEFMESMMEYFKNMPDKEFDTHKESVATRREKPKMMREQSLIYWREIIMQQYHFDRTNTEVSYLKTITKDQMMKYFEEFIYTKTKHYRKLSVHVVPTTKGTSDCEREMCGRKETAEEGPWKIKDELHFKANHSLYPLVEPYNNVPRKGTHKHHH